MSFVPVSQPLLKLIGSMKFRCKYAENGCPEVLSSKGYEILKHQNSTCQFKREQDRRFIPARDFCKLCTNRLLPPGAQDGALEATHLCASGQNNAYC